MFIDSNEIKRCDPLGVVSPSFIFSVNMRPILGLFLPSLITKVFTDLNPEGIICL